MEQSALIQFVGRLHPLLVHLPIGFLILLGALETVALFPRFKSAAAGNRQILWLTFPAAICTVICGWLLALSGGYEATTLFWHRWLGTAVAVVTAVLLVLHWRGAMVAYRLSLLGTLGLLAVASHFGGSLTHGSDYLTLPFRVRYDSGEHAHADEDAGSAYRTVIEPIFQTYCVSCHGSNKSKGGLRLHTYEDLVRGGDSGPVIEPGNATASLLSKRLVLPEDSEDHMPPEGKRQPSPDDIALVQWWINSGASEDKAVRELNPTAEIERIIAAKTSAARP